MVLKLYGYPQSANLKIVATVLHEKNVPFEFVIVDMAKGEHKSPQHREKHPFGLVPYIDDDGFILYETRAIARYIATKHADQGPKLIPTDLKGNALFEQAASIETANFQPFALGFLVEKFKPTFGQQTDEAVVEKHRATLNEKLDVYEKILSKQTYVAGDILTLADLFHLPFAALLVECGASDIIEKRLNVKRWFDDLSSRSSWQAVKAEVKGTVSGPVV